jgi:DNA-binding transcriptional LysR family regulator
MKHLNFRQLEAFQAVADYGSITAAAKQLHISQPAVTRLVRELEAQVGFAVFKRHANGCIPTAEGLELHKDVSRLLAISARVSENAKSIHDARSKRLLVGCPTSIATQCMPRIVNRAIQHNPGFTVAVSFDRSLGLIDMVSRGFLDAALAIVPEGRVDVRQELVISVDAICLMPRTHRLARKSVIAPADLAGEALICNPKVGKFRSDLDKCFSEAGMQLIPKVETFSSSFASHVAGGIGIALGDPLGLVGVELGSLVLRRFAPKATMDLSLVFPPNEHSDSVDEFAAAARAVLHEEINRLAKPHRPSSK